MIKNILKLTLLLSVISFPAMANVDGLWMTENKRAVIDVKPCADGGPVCGEIAWIIDGGMTVDAKNENPELRNQPLCGLQILNGFKSGAKSNEWVDGKIYKADDGDVYNASITQIDENRLRLRGYVGIPLFGKTQIWTRVPDNHPRCD